MIDNSLQQLLQPIITTLGYELIGVERILMGKKTTLVRLYIDNPQGIRLHDCEIVSYQISGLLDVEGLIFGQYTLEVSSPGLARPLFTLQQFTRYTGRKVSIRLTHPLASRRHFKGILQRIEQDNIILSIDGTEHIIPYVQISKAHLVPEET